jgi:hypothetical protein
MKSENFKFKKEVDEVIIVKKTDDGQLNVEAKCYRPLPGR